MPGDRELERRQVGKDISAILAQLAKFVVGKLRDNRGSRSAGS